MKQIFYTILLCLISSPAWSQGHKLCITIDDLPFVGYSRQSTEQHESLSRKLLQAISKNDIPVTGFVNEYKLYTNGVSDSLKVNLLRLWLAQGLELGNHSYSHQNFHQVSFSAYTNDILKGEVICKELVRTYGKEFRYFRHPYLRIGTSRSAHDSLNVFLNTHGYTEAPVTIDNTDYMFAAAYDKAFVMDDQTLMREIGEKYILYMEEKLQFYQAKSEELFGRNISHILLLHANALNADYLDELAGMFRKNQYSFITLETALQDPAYKSELSKYGDWGISWIDRWAMSQGKSSTFFKGDPETPELIKELLK